MAAIADGESRGDLIQKSLIKKRDMYIYEDRCKKIKAISCILFAIIAIVVLSTLLKMGVFKI